jgi:hypothetical protein
MPRPLGSRFAWPALVLGLGLLVGGCEAKLGGIPIPNQLPEVTLTAAPADTSARYYYTVTLSWSGFDPDGMVDYVLYAVDPPSGLGEDTTWVSTRDRRITVEFKSGQPSPGADSMLISQSPHTFVILGVDNRGAKGPRVSRSFFSYTQAPIVNITNPRPSQLLEFAAIPTLEVSWTGTDPDGQHSKKPIGYKYLLVGASYPIPMTEILLHPSIVTDTFAPDFPATDGWVACSAESTFARFTNLTPGSNYLFIVVAFDEAGAYSPVSFENNILRFRVGYAGSSGPRFTLFNDFFSYTYSGGGYNTDPSFWVPLEIPTNTRVTINWTAAPPNGANLVGYRWALDIEHLDDETPRSDEFTDLAHWSTMAKSTTSAILGPFAGATQDHFLYVEVLDNLGLRSLAIVALHVVQATFDQPLLIVDDTRRTPDGIDPNGQPSKPTGPWPMAAELDTFLYARGNVPWKDKPLGTLSPAGLFNGYAFDTIGTRLQKADLTIPLAVIGRYRHVVWLVDGKGGTYRRSPLDLNQPQTSLYYMGTQGHTNTIGAYIAQGGQLWVAGGGIAMASQMPTNVSSNDRPTITFSAAAGELIPGRFMYEYPVWRSEIRTAAAVGAVSRYLGRLEGTGSVYDALPPVLETKTPTSDPSFRYAPGRRDNEYYLTTTDFEFLQKPNNILEDDGTDPQQPHMVAVMDTLYHVDAASLPTDNENPYNVVMTYYHGAEHSSVVACGFNLWTFKHDQLVQIVDLVLGRLWGLPKSPTAMVSAPRLTSGAATASRPMPRAGSLAAPRPPNRRAR